MEKVYYLATNIWGHNRTLQPNNGWTVSAFYSEQARDNVYNGSNYIDTGAFIPTDSDIRAILGAGKNDRYGVSQIGSDEDGYEVGIC